MAQKHGSPIVTDGLVLCLDAGNPKSYSGSGSTWYDRSGQGRNGTLKNMETADFDGTDNGGSLTFGGTNEKVEIDHFDYDRTNFTAEVVGKFNVNHGGWHSAFFGKWQTGATANNEFNLGASGVSGPSPFVFVCQDVDGTTGNSLFKLTSSFNYVVGITYHLIGTFNNGVMRLYVNGELAASGTASFTEVKSFSSQKFNIAGFGSSYYTQCTINLARMYNKTLTADEILQNFNATKHRFNLDAYQ